MKMTPSDYANLEQVIKQVMGNNPTISYESYKVKGLTYKRFIWDVFNFINGLCDFSIQRGLYKYLNDTHIETALKRIMKNY